MQTHRLNAHPAHPPVGVSEITARIIGRDDNWLRVRWRVEGSQSLVIPPFAGKGRADGIWQTTCFELFLQPVGGAGYAEFNLSPSERWAAYDFDAPRAGMRERPVSREPACTMRQGSSFAIFDAALPIDSIPATQCAMALTAVIEEQGGAKSFWALAHSDPQKPDFHDPACFVASLAAPPPA